MPIKGISPIAVQVEGRTTNVKFRTPWGLLLHTTGSGIVEKAKKTKKTPIEVALKWYRLSQDGASGYPWGGPTYVMDHDGTIYQIANESIVTNHCGAPNRADYLAGTWINKCSKAMVAQWHAHWGPKYKNPYQLFPSKSPNTDFVGVEMIPCGAGFGTPMRPDLKFTRAQHDAVITLGCDVAKRNLFPTAWANTSRLVGHEDIQPIDRHDKNGGWDPGWLREKPYFDFSYVRDGI